MVAIIPESDEVVVVPHGCIDATSASALLAEIDARLGPCGTDLVVDMADVDSIDAAGCAVLREASRRLARSHDHLVLTHVRPRVARVLRDDGLRPEIRSVH